MGVHTQARPLTLIQIPCVPGKGHTQLFPQLFTHKKAPCLCWREVEREGSVGLGGGDWDAGQGFCLGLA